MVGSELVENRNVRVRVREESQVFYVKRKLNKVELK